MASGLFILLFDEKSLSRCLKYGIYGFFMPPVFESQPTSQSRHYAILADYACCHDETHIFFFHKRKVTYGGIIKSDTHNSAFYLNGPTSPLGRKANAPLFWDESGIYPSTDKEGVFIIDEKEKSMPFILKFETDDNISGKQISVDSLYFELGEYGYPLPSNAIQNLGCCTLTPRETEILLKLLEESDDFFSPHMIEDMKIGEKQTAFTKELLDLENYINESELEFSLIADFNLIKSFLDGDSYVVCRQVPICPIKPMNYDRADIVLYNLDKPIKNNTIPNIVIELKKDKVSFSGYKQVVRYFKWLKKITPPEDFVNIRGILIAPSFSKRLTYENLVKKNINTEYITQIELYSLENKDFHNINIDKNQSTLF